MYQIRDKLTKDYILRRIRQEDIFKMYLGEDVQFDYLIQNPLRVLITGEVDTNPTASFYMRGNKIKFKDWSGCFWGDCFDVVGVVIGENPNSKLGFSKILEHIARQFKLHKYSGNNPQQLIIDVNKVVEPKAKAKLEVLIRDWHNVDAKYWSQFKIINRAVLEREGVFPIEKLWINDFLKYDRFNYRDPAYVYYMGENADGTEKMQIYFPLRPKNQTRFILNNSELFGYNQLTKGEIVLGTKSNKDRIVLKELFSLVCEDIGIAINDIQFFALPFETYTLRREEAMRLWTDFKLPLTLFDFDMAGRNAAWKHNNLYAMRPLFLTDGKRGSKIDYKVKDISEYIAKYDVNKAKELLTKTHKYVMDKFYDRVKRNT